MTLIEKLKCLDEDMPFDVMVAENGEEFDVHETFWEAIEQLEGKDGSNG